MNEFHAELLIGGMRLDHLHGELAREEPLTDSRAWLLAGQLHVPPQQQEQLQLERQYLLRLDDGREGLIELVSLTTADGDVLADFQPRTVRPR